MSKINGYDKVTPENRSEFKRLFIEEFLKEMETEDVDTLMELGDFQANWHSIHEACPKDMDDKGGCSHCYSGDTEYEMNSISYDLGSVWKRAYARLPVPDDSDGEEE